MKLLEIPVNQIATKENVRGKIKDILLHELMNSIKQDGLLQPIGVNKIGSKYQVVYGHRRLAAITKLGIKNISCIIFENLNNKDSILTNVLENIQRKDLSVFEYGRVINILMEEEKMTPSEIASRLGVSCKRIAQCISAFTKTPFEFRDKIKPIIGGTNAKRGCIPVAIAHEIAMLKNVSKENRLLLYEQARQDGFTRQHYNVLVTLLADNMDFTKALKKAKALKAVRVTVTMSLGDYNRLKKIGQVGTLLKTLIYGENKIKPIKRIL